MNEQTTVESPPFDGAPSPTRIGAAWLLSVVGHTVLFVALSLLLGRSVSRGLGDEGDRSGGIVVAVQNTSNQVEYLTAEEDTTDVAQAAEAEASEPLFPEEPPLAANDLAVESGANTLPLPGPTMSVNDLTNPLSSSGSSLGLSDDGDAEFIRREQQRLRNRPQRNTGDPTALSIFGSAAARGHRFVFVIDRSKSMGGQGLGALAAARDELSAQLQILNENHSFQIVAYHHTTVMMRSRRLLEATEENVAKVDEFLGQLAAFGGTDHDAGIHAALSLDPDVIFFLTDGDQPGLAEYQLEEIHNRARGRVTIHCVQFGAGTRSPDAGFMERLAADNGGSFVYVNMNRRN